MTTLHDNYQLAVKKYPNNNCYGWRVVDGATAGPYQWMTYKEANTAATVYTAHTLSMLWCTNLRVVHMLLLYYNTTLQ
jgi:hypothetical protein